jgi:hypothetical protein
MFMFYPRFKSFIQKYPNPITKVAENAAPKESDFLVAIEPIAAETQIQIIIIENVDIYNPP